MTNSIFNHLSGIISYFKIHCKVLYWARVPEVKWWLGWSVWRGHELLSANNSLVSYCQLPSFSVWMALSLSLQWGNGKYRMFWSVHSVSFSTTCKCISSHFLMCLLLCVLWSLLPPSVSCFFKCIWAHEQLCFRFWGVMGCFLRLCGRHMDPAVTSIGQLFTFAHTGQPCSPSLHKILQIFPRKIAAKKGKNYDRHTVDGWCFHALLNTLPWIQLQCQSCFSHF